MYKPHTARHGSTHIIEPVAGSEDDVISRLHGCDELGVKLVKPDVVRVHAANLLRHTLQAQSSIHEQQNSDSNESMPSDPRART